MPPRVAVCVSGFIRNGTCPAMTQALRRHLPPYIQDLFVFAPTQLTEASADATVTDDLLKEAYAGFNVTSRTWTYNDAAFRARVPEDFREVTNFLKQPVHRILSHMHHMAGAARLAMDAGAGPSGAYDYYIMTRPDNTLNRFDDAVFDPEAKMHQPHMALLSKRPEFPECTDMFEINDWFFVVPAKHIHTIPLMYDRAIEYLEEFFRPKPMGLFWIEGFIAYHDWKMKVPVRCTTLFASSLGNRCGGPCCRADVGKVLS